MIQILDWTEEDSLRFHQTTCNSTFFKFRNCLFLELSFNVFELRWAGDGHHRTWNHGWGHTVLWPLRMVYLRAGQVGERWLLQDNPDPGSCLRGTSLSKGPEDSLCEPPSRVQSTSQCVWTWRQVRGNKREEHHLGPSHSKTSIYSLILLAHSLSFSVSLPSFLLLTVVIELRVWCMLGKRSSVEW